MGTEEAGMVGDEAAENGLGATGKGVNLILKATWKHRRIQILRENDET